MAYKDLDKKKAYFEAYYQKNKPKYAASHEAWKAANPETFRASVRKHQEANREKLNAKMKARYHADEAFRAKRRKSGRAAQLRKYGLTQDGYRDMLDAQGGGCAICTKSFRVAIMHVDHCHATGKVRGILCRQCNVALGLFGDDPDRLMEAAEYLRNASSGATSTTSSEPLETPSIQ